MCPEINSWLFPCILFHPQSLPSEFIGGSVFHWPCLKTQELSLNSLHLTSHPNGTIFRMCRLSTPPLLPSHWITLTASKMSPLSSCILHPSLSTLTWEPRCSLHVSQIIQSSLLLQWHPTSLWVEARGMKNWPCPPAPQAESSPASSPPTLPRAPTAHCTAGKRAILPHARYSFPKDCALSVPLSEMGFTQVPKCSAHSLTYLRPLLEGHLLSTLLKLEPPPPRLPLHLPCFNFLNNIIMSVFLHKRFIYLLLLLLPLKTGVFSVIVTAISLVPRAMPGTWYMLHKYLLSQWNKGSVSLWKVNRGTMRTNG